MTNTKTHLVIRRLDTNTYQAFLTEDGVKPYEGTSMVVCFEDAGKVTSSLGGEFFPDADMKMEALFLMKWMDERCRR